MAPTRRNFLTIGGLAAASTVLSSCGPFPGTLLERGAGLVDLVDGSRLPPEFAASGTDTWRVLSRATFGPCADERARAAQLGLDAWIDEQLAPETIADTDALLRRAAAPSRYAADGPLDHFRGARGQRPGASFSRRRFCGPCTAGDSSTR